MKIDARQIDGFLRNPEAATVVLLHGEDAGLVRERGSMLARAVAGSIDDPFRLVELGRDQADSIADEMASMSLTGGRRVVRVRDATDGLAGQVQRVLDADRGGFLILEAVDLPSRGKLRALVEKAKKGAATQELRSTTNVHLGVPRVTNPQRILAGQECHLLTHPFLRLGP